MEPDPPALAPLMGAVVTASMASCRSTVSSTSLPLEARSRDDTSGRHSSLVMGEDTERMWDLVIGELLDFNGPVERLRFNGPHVWLPGCARGAVNDFENETWHFIA